MVRQVIHPLCLAWKVKGLCQPASGCHQTQPHARHILTLCIGSIFTLSIRSHFFTLFVQAGLITGGHVGDLANKAARWDESVLEGLRKQLGDVEGRLKV